MAFLNVNGEQHYIDGDRITAGALKQEFPSPANHMVVVRYTWGEKHMCDDDEEITAKNVEAVSILPPGEQGER